MARTISLAAAISLALLGLVFAIWGSSPEASVQGRVSPSAGLAHVRDPAAPRGTSQPQATAAAPMALALRPTTGPMIRPRDDAPHPPARSFWATGPLVARLSDPEFGPALRPANLLVPDPPRRLAGADDLLCLAVAIYHEARDQPLDGQLAVASVILNRTKEPARWGATPCEVVVPVQFSFMAEDGSYPAIPKDEVWAIALEMAREALELGPSPLVGDADHYHTPEVDPDWDETMDQVVRIEDHIFFLDPATRG